MALVRMSAANIMMLWKVSITSTPTVMRLVKQEDLAETQEKVYSGTKCRGQEPDGDRARLSKKFRAIASGK